MENSIGNLKWLALNLEIALYRVDTEQDPVVSAESSQCPLPAFRLWNNFSQRISLISSVQSLSRVRLFATP